MQIAANSRVQSKQAVTVRLTEDNRWLVLWMLAVACWIALLAAV